MSRLFSLGGQNIELHMSPNEVATIEHFIDQGTA